MRQTWCLMASLQYCVCLFIEKHNIGKDQIPKNKSSKPIDSALDFQKQGSSFPGFLSISGIGHFYCIPLPLKVPGNHEKGFAGPTHTNICRAGGCDVEEEGQTCFLSSTLFHQSRFYRQKRQERRFCTLPYPQQFPESTWAPSWPQELIYPEIDGTTEGNMPQTSAPSTYRSQDRQPIGLRWLPSACELAIQQSNSRH